MPQFDDSRIRRAPRASRKKKMGKMTPKKVKAIVEQSLVSLSETKHYDKNYSAVVIPPGANLTLDLSDVPQGISENERTGDHIRPNYLGVRYFVRGQVGSVPNQGQVRILLVRCRFNTASAPPLLTEVVNNTADPMSFRETQYTKMYNVLYDATHVITQSSANKNHEVQGSITLSKFPKDTDISLNDAGVEGENKMYLMVYHNFTSTVPTFNATCRLRYNDY